MGTLRAQQQEGELERRELDLRGQELLQESLQTDRTLEESRRDAQRYRSSLDIISR